MTTDIEKQRRLLRERGICAIIPVYNNEATVAGVVEDTLRECADVIVVDDGSTDGTPRSLAAIEGITLVTLSRNRGKGHALREGFRKALSMGFAYAITLDADGQHYPADIPLFLEANIKNPGCLIVGSRQLEGVERTKGSGFANKFSNFWFTVQTGVALDDTQTGYRLYPLRKLHWLGVLSARYEAELALMVTASWHGVRIVPIKVRVYYPPRSQRVTHFRPYKDFARISALNAVLCVLAVVYGWPARLLRAVMTVGRTLYSLLTFTFFCTVVSTPIVWLCMKLGGRTELGRKRLHEFIYRSVRFIMITHGVPGTRFVSKVADPTIDLSKPRIIICNHQSHFDIMCQMVFTPNVVFLTNDWVWNNPIYGFLIREAEYLPASRGLGAIMPQLRSLVARGYSVAVFPEGTRSADCRIARFHQGAFYLASQLGLEVLPMYLYGAGKILPKRTYHLRKGIFYIEVGKPVTQEELQAMGSTMQQASCMRRRYIEKYAEMANRIEQDV